MKRRTAPYTRQASSSTCVPYVLFIVNARLLPKLLSTCVCARMHGEGSPLCWWTCHPWFHSSVGLVTLFPERLAGSLAAACMLSLHVQPSPKGHETMGTPWLHLGACMGESLACMPLYI